MNEHTRYIALDEAGYLRAMADTPVGGGLEEPIRLPEDFRLDYLFCYFLEGGAPVLDADKLARALADEERERGMPTAMAFMQAFLEGYHNG